MIWGVHFSYEADREILKGISMEIPAGSFVSIVGESGCGKSTIVSLLAQKNVPDTGGILVTSENRTENLRLSEIKPEDWRQETVVVSHNAYLFGGTVRENLQIAGKDISEEQMKECLQRVDLWSFLQSREGLDTLLTENAQNLSGGQRQRLALARALLYHAGIYIFDEAASNVDIESEERIMEVIRELAGTHTVIMISHRLANVISSDQIYMMDQGNIVEHGTHEELMAQKGSYAALYGRQKMLENYGKEAEG